MSTVGEWLLIRLALSVLAFAVIWGGSHLIDHPVVWWLAVVAALMIVFLGEWILDGSN